MPAASSAAMIIDNSPINTFAADASKVVTIGLNPNRAYRLKHRGKDTTGTADVNDILIGSGGVDASYLDGVGTGIMEAQDIIEVNGCSVLAIKATAGKPCITITVINKQTLNG